MAPAQQHMEMCNEEMKQSEPKIYKNNEKDFENNNTVLENSASDKVTCDTDFDIKKYEAMKFNAQIRWPDLIVQILLHLVSIYGLYLIISNQVKLLTILFGKCPCFLFVLAY